MPGVLVPDANLIPSSSTTRSNFCNFSELGSITLTNRSAFASLMARRAASLTATSLSTLPSLYGMEATRTPVSGVMGAGACVDNALAGTRRLGVARGVNARARGRWTRPLASFTREGGFSARASASAAEECGERGADCSLGLTPLVYNAWSIATCRVRRGTRRLQKFLRLRLRRSVQRSMAPVRSRRRRRPGLRRRAGALFVGVGRFHRRRLHSRRRPRARRRRLTLEPVNDLILGEFGM